MEIDNKELIKINLGCGKDFRKGWINVDENREVKADVYCDFSKEKLPFKDNYADEILLDNVLEHIRPEKYFAFMEEVWRVAKPDAPIIIYVPHYSGMYALKHPTHYMYFGIGSMDIFTPEGVFNGERYSKARFIVEKEKLLFFHHNLGMYTLSKLPLNWPLNFGRLWQLLMERFNLFGFDEIKYILLAKKDVEVIKK